MTRRKPRRIGIDRRFAWLSVRLIVALVLLRCLSAAQSSAPPVSRSIEGVVLDRAGVPVPGAVVLIKDLKSLQIRSFIAQEDGKYHFRGLSPDVNYQVRAQFNGAVSGAKTISVFETSPKILVNLKLAVKLKRTVPSGNS
jgi:hypothetical protein